jgi:hypothetical protein
MKYNPKSPLSEDEVVKLSDDELFEYLDSKAKYLSQFAEPLDEYHTKQFASVSKKGERLTDEELKKAKEIGKIGNNIKADKISEAAKKMKKPDLGVKVKKRGDGWID